MLSFYLRSVKQHDKIKKNNTNKSLICLIRIMSQLLRKQKKI